MNADSSDLKRLARTLPNGAAPFPDVITAGQPSADQIKALGKAGVHMVLDLRLPDEDRGFSEREVVEQAGMEYRNVPVSYDGVSDETFEAVRVAIGAHRPIVVHCRSANRVGGMLLPYLALDEGQDVEDAFDLACAIGLKNAALTEWAMDYVERHAETK